MQSLPQTFGSDPSAILQSVTQRAQVLTRGTAAAIALAHQGSMICKATVGTNAPTLGCRVDVSTGFSAECIRSGKAIRCDDSSADPRVDAEICRTLGIRSILAAPIPLHGQVVGLLEVFSSQRFAFHDGDLAVLDQLAQTALVPPSSNKPVPVPSLLIEFEPAYRVFLSNLVDLVHPPRTASLKLTSRPGRFWPDVFVPSRVPWKQFAQSMVLQTIMLAGLGALLELGLSQPRLRQTPSFNKEDIVYYLPAEYLPLVTKQPATPQHTTALAKSPVLSAKTKLPALSVRRGSGPARAEASIVPPKAFAGSRLAPVAHSRAQCDAACRPNVGDDANSASCTRSERCGACSATGDLCSFRRNTPGPSDVGGRGTCASRTSVTARFRKFEHRAIEGHRASAICT